MDQQPEVDDVPLGGSSRQSHNIMISEEYDGDITNMAQRITPSLPSSGELLPAITVITAKDKLAVQSQMSASWVWSQWEGDATFGSDLVRMNPDGVVPN